MANEIEAINVLQMTVNENKRFSVDFTQYLQKGERITGVVAISFTLATGTPTISEQSFSSDGKFLNFRLTCDGTQKPKTHGLKFRVTTLRNGATDTVEARATLKLVA